MFINSRDAVLIQRREEFWFSALREFTIWLEK
jgi:hypothetical protein